MNAKNRIFIATVFLVLVVGAIYIALSDDSSNTVTGNAVVDTRVSILPFVPSNCSFTLHQGWNLVSFYCISMYDPVTKIMGPVNTTYGAVFYYDPHDPIDPWKSYNPDLPEWTVQQLQTMDRVSGYWVYMQQDSPYAYPGAKKQSVIELHPGWNMIGYPRMVPALVNDTLDGISFTQLRTYISTDGQWIIYVPDQSGNTLTQFETYLGYWMNASDAQSITLEPTDEVP